MEKKLLLFLCCFLAMAHFGRAMVLDKSAEVLTRCSWNELPDELKRDLEEITVPPTRFEGEGLSDEDRILLDFLQRKYRRTYRPNQVFEVSSRRYFVELLLATYAGDEAAVAGMINGENILPHDIDQVFIIALKRGHLGILSLFFMNEIGDGIAGVLKLAARYGNFPFVQFLYEKFINVRDGSGAVTGNKNVSLIDRSTLLCAITLASIDGHDSLIRFLCAELPPQLGKAVLGVYKGDTNDLESLLQAEDEDVRGSCLLIAVLRNQIPLLEMIVKLGVSKKSIHIALRIATITDCSPAVAFLLSRGPQEIERVESLRYALDQKNCDLVDLLTRHAEGSYARGYALRIASENGSCAIVKMLLRSNITRIDAECALVIASTYGHEEIVRLLLASGLCDAEKDQAYAQAVVNGNDSIAQLLLAAGARSIESLCSAAVPTASKDLLKLCLDPEVLIEDLVEKNVRMLELGNLDIGSLLEGCDADKNQFLSDCFHNAIIMRRFHALELLMQLMNLDCKVDEEALVDGYLTLLELGKDGIAQRLAGMSKRSSEEFLGYCCHVVISSGNVGLLETVLNHNQYDPFDNMCIFISKSTHEVLVDEALRQNYPLAARLIIFGTEVDGYSLSHSKIYSIIPLAQKYKNDEIVAMLKAQLEAKTRKEAIRSAGLVLPCRYRRLKTLLPGAMSNRARAALLQEVEHEYDTNIDGANPRFNEEQMELYKLLLRDDVRNYSARRTALYPLLAVMRKQAEWKSYSADPDAFIRSNEIQKRFANRQTYLIWAVMFDHRNVMTYLIAQRMPRYYINARDGYGYTALMYAAGLGNDRMIRDLLETGCCKYRFGEAIKEDRRAIFEALTCAESNDHFAIVTKLLIYLVLHMYLM